MFDWKNVGVPIIVALLSLGSAIIVASFAYIASVILKPNISITTASSSNLHTTIFDITNIGSAPAKDLKVTVEAPPNVTFNHPIFSTERYTENKTRDPSLLELYVPRFVQGPGSLIRIDTLIARGASLSGSYTFYVTYE